MEGETSSVTCVFYAFVLMNCVPLQLARDELQTDMISETNRKRRRLERERRAIERPQPSTFHPRKTIYSTMMLTRRYLQSADSLISLRILQLNPYRHSARSCNRHTHSVLGGTTNPKADAIIHTRTPSSTLYTPSFRHCPQWTSSATSISSSKPGSARGREKGTEGACTICVRSLT